ncbi:MAG: sulfatase-like hydrolase/transferase [Myxococcota bacterium]|nr:sulfatase-like hydrolase/transferase [Myxococcota bacterium]
MKYTRLLGTLPVVAFGSLLPLACSKETPERPNIVLITLDTTRADVMGAYGGNPQATPAFDALAAEGLLLDRAYTVTPLTIPAHSSLFTGLWPPRHGVRDNGDFFLSEGADTLAEQLLAQGYDTMASVSAQVTSHHWGFAQGFNAFFDDMGSSQETQANRWKVERPGESAMDDAVAWLAERTSPTQPFFAWIHLFDAHHPYVPPEPYKSRFAGKPYLGEVATADAQLGRLVRWLENNQEWDNTWIVVTADHGEALGSHGESTHGVLLYDPTIRVPLVIRPPGGLDEPVRSSVPASLVDISPTLLNAAGIEVPGGLDGQDLWPLSIHNDTSNETRTVYAESLYAWHHYGWAPQRALVTPTHKLIDSTTDELYEKSDVQEAQDLAPVETQTTEALANQLELLTQAMEPLESASDRVVLSAERIAQLEALGYVASDPPPEAAVQDGPLPDPRSRLPLLKQAQGARKSFQAGDLKGALKQIEAVLAIDPGLVELRTLQANVLSRMGRIPEAIATLEAAEATRPSSATRSAMGRLWLSTDPSAAADLLANALEKDPYVESSWIHYLHALLLSGRIDLLEQEATRALSLLPKLPEASGMLGIARAARNDLAGTEDLLKRSLAARPIQPFVSEALARIERKRGDVVSAEGHLVDEVRYNPPALSARRSLVEIYAEQRRYAEQLEQLQAIEAVEPPSQLTSHSSAQALFNLERYEEAHERTLECRQLAPSYPGCALLAANILKKLGQDEQAATAFETAKDLARAQGIPIGE